MLKTLCFDLKRMETVRIDKWLWAVRVYKTRSDAAHACRTSAVRLNGLLAKPSAKLRIGDTVVARTKVLTRTLKVVALTEKRVGAPRVIEFLEDHTPESEHEAAREKQAHARSLFHKFSEAKGRPTKKDRREMDKLMGPEE